MFFVRKPSEQKIEQFIQRESQRPFSYAEVGTTRTTPPAGYVIDRNRSRLGAGLETFEQAKAALRGWEMFRLGWIQLCWPDTPIEVGATVAVLARVSGLWFLNACRIVYLIEEDGPRQRFGFAYGTLPAHAERGEERFCVEWHREDDSVWYDILAFSQPNQFLSRLGYPFARHLQKRFAADSMAAMQRAVRNSFSNG